MIEEKEKRPEIWNENQATLILRGFTCSAFGNCNMTAP